MKPIRFSKKLRLNKKTIVDLSSKEMNAVNGGADIPDTKSCPFTFTKCQTQCPSNGSMPYICCNLC
ncbi:MAG: class I lanthipeptide [Candidatus Aminicenantes bacterium]|nr:MAG: class I lanthipeptide [Candidatus Aminicenantes bacterium]